jgi:hypothetical protein
MRALALVLAVAVPSMSFAQQKVSLDSLGSDQPISQRLLIDEAFNAPAQPAVSHAWVWWTVGASVFALGIIAALSAAVIAAQPRTVTPVMRSDFACNPRCDAFINAPPQ